MSPAPTDGRPNERPRSRPAASQRAVALDAALSIAGVFACEVAAGLTVVITRRPAPGIALTAAALVLGLGWLRRHRRRADAIAANEVALGERLLAAGSLTAAWNAGCAAAWTAARRPVANAGLAVMARVALEEKRLDVAREILGRIRPRRSVDPCLEAVLERAAGRHDRAREALERARGRPTFGGAAARLLVELHAEANDLDRAVGVAVAHLDLLEPHDVENMIASLRAWGEPQHAARLGVALSLNGQPA
jgi:hypothetical protein